jgi:hypothetical protein
MEYLHPVFEQAAYMNRIGMNSNYHLVFMGPSKSGNYPCVIYYGSFKERQKSIGITPPVLKQYNNGLIVKTISMPGKVRRRRRRIE